MTKRITCLATMLVWLTGCSDPESDRSTATDTETETPQTVDVAADIADKAPSPPPLLPKVLERFEVGRNVYVRALKADPDRNSLWVGTSSGVHEVNLKDGSVQQTFTRTEGLANEYVFAIGIDHKGNKWFGTNSGGVSRYKDGEWKTIFPMHGLADYWVYAFDSQRDGTLWIGTWAGANSVHPESGELTTYVRELVNEWVYGIAVDSKDRVWFGTEGGISRYDGKEWVSWTHADGMGAANEEGRPPSKNTGLGTRERHDLGVLSGGMATYNPGYVFSVLIDDADVLWAGTWGGGLARFDGENWVNYTEADGLAGNIVYALERDTAGVLWIGTNKGLSRFDGQHWQTYGRHEGLANLNVYAIESTADGDIWIGTREAVVRLGLEKSEEN
jgi:ligand-binding sensor domain-containing protein